MSAHYLAPAMDPKGLTRIAKDVYQAFKQSKTDILVARGVSGIIVVSAVAALHGVPFAIVRKPGESTHSSNEIEISNQEYTYGGNYRDWLIVDDFIASGKTVREIYTAVKENECFRGMCTGIVLYNSCKDWKTSWELPNKVRVPIIAI